MRHRDQARLFETLCKKTPPQSYAFCEHRRYADAFLMGDLTSCDFTAPGFGVETGLDLCGSQLESGCEGDAEARAIGDGLAS